MDIFISSHVIFFLFGWVALHICSNISCSYSYLYKCGPAPWSPSGQSSWKQPHIFPNICPYLWWSLFSLCLLDQQGPHPLTSREPGLRLCSTCTKKTSTSTSTPIIVRWFFWMLYILNKNSSNGETRTLNTKNWKWSWEVHCFSRHLIYQILFK